ncbi:MULTISPECIES: DUF3180 domain-containing protein [unclassified Saccharopolyspora]|uniref:DUF3180 domain-containing protein n=1 Tax=Saccharopolyspora TaxID=1835 RepID=UPI00190D311F|nr:DUF3180 domain-containing protein [Saccharopolyspora sp. HNM0986]MBK0865609.1 DUF3180 domain-containing protein [Saccharopolyspora sp. HNM0986]
MSFTQIRHLVIAAVVAGALAYLGCRAAYGGLPRLPALAGATLLLVAIVDVILASTMRPRILRKSGTEPVDSLTAARAVALAKASSMAGAIMGGVWLGLLGFLLPMRGEVQAAASDTPAAVIGLVSAALLVAAGLWLEHCLRNPDDPEEHDDEE